MELEKDSMEVAGGGGLSYGVGYLVSPNYDCVCVEFRLMIQ